MFFEDSAERRAYQQQRDEYYALLERIPHLPKLKVDSKEEFEKSWPIFLKNVANVRESNAFDAVTEFIDGPSFVLDFWFENRDKDPAFEKTLAYAKRTILKAFDQRMSPVDAMARFFKRTQCLNEDTIDFYYAIKGFLNQAGLDPEKDVYKTLARYRFLTGIHPELRFILFSEKPDPPKDSEEVFRLVSKIELRMKNDVGRFEKPKKYPAATTDRCLKCGYKECSCSVDVGKPCWICNSSGHLPKNCAEK